VNRFAAGAALALGLVTARVEARDWTEVRARGVLRWGGDLQGGEPYVFEDPEAPGHITGFEVDIVAALGRRLELQTEFVQTDWSSLIPALERNDFDLIVNGLEDTESRRARILLSRPYFVYGETLAVAAGSTVKSLAELQGKRVGTLNQTVAHELLKLQPLEVVLYEGQQEPYLDLAQGRTQGVLLDHVIADRYGCTSPKVQCVPGDVARGTYVMGVAQHDRALIQEVDRALGALVRDGELQKILEHWQLWDARQAALNVAPSATSSQKTPEKAPESPEAAAVISRRLSAAQLALLLESALVTVLLSIAAFALASPLGLAIAIARVYGGRVVRALAAAYVEFFRGTPLLLQLYVLYFGIADYVRLGPLTAALVGLGLNYGAYEAEVHRGALLSVPRIQSEAARALGLSQFQALRYVLLPQSLRTALPAVTNDFIALLKDSSLVSVVTVVELTKRMTIVAVELRDWVVPGLLCAGLYFTLSFPLARLARRLEKKLQHDSHSRAH
jgi:polar amino acid transport system substrate-binding protein